MTLRPCPFCGSDKIKSQIFGGASHSECCKNCKAYGPEAQNLHGAIAAWNRRATTPDPDDPATVAARERIEALEQALTRSDEALARIETRTLDDYPPFRVAPVEAFLPLIRRTRAVLAALKAP